MSFLIYKHTNKTSGKSYIGLTGRTIIQRWNEHCYQALVLESPVHFHRAIRLYGKDDWKSTVLEDNIPSVVEAQTFEKAYILKYDTFENGYNSTLGGEGVSGLNPFKDWTDERKREHSNTIKRNLQDRYNTQQVQLFHKDYGLQIGMPVDIITEYNIHSEVYNVLKGNRRHIQGWFLYVGPEGDYNEQPIYKFIHEDYGIEVGTLKEVSKKYNLSKGNLSMVTSGQRTHTKGWRLYKEGQMYA